MAVVTIYPSVDGYVLAGSDSVGRTWASILADSSGLRVGLSDATMPNNAWIATVANTYFYIYRPICSFDLSAIGAGATFTACDFVVKGQSKITTDATPTYNIYRQTLASVSTFDATAWGGAGSTAFCDTAITSAAFSVAGFAGTNTWALNATGLAAMDPTSFIALVIRSSNDTSGTGPTAGAWTFHKGYEINLLTSETSGTTDDPHITATYTAAPPAGGHRMFFAAS